jgi:hypothetical protein
MQIFRHYLCNVLSLSVFCIKAHVPAVSTYLPWVYVKRKAVPVPIARRYNDVWGSESVAPPFSTKDRCLASRPVLLYPWERGTGYQLDRLGGPRRGRSGGDTYCLCRESTELHIKFQKTADIVAI